MNEQSVLTIKNKNEVLYLRKENILYIQADGNYCNIHLADGGVINTLTYQRAEIARMMDEQFSKECRERFIMLGKSYMVNIDYVFRIQPGKQLLTFSINKFGSTEKLSIKASSKALTKFQEDLEIISPTIDIQS